MSEKKSSPGDCSGDKTELEKRLLELRRSIEMALGEADILGLMQTGIHLDEALHAIMAEIKR